MQVRDRQVPCVHVSWREDREPDLTEGCGRLSEHPAQLGQRDGLRLMHLQVLVDQLAERHRCCPSSGSEPCEYFLERLQRLSASRESADLRPHRAAPLEPVAVRPQRLTVPALRPQLEHLALLPHHEPPRSIHRIEESQRAQAEPMTTPLTQRASRGLSLN